MFPSIPLEAALLRLALAFALGAAIGFERERGERGAGLRTHALVCIGSALIMLVSIYGFSDLPLSDGASFDPSRIAAQAVSGIGFLGAGVILLREEIVRGLTTAAALWFVAGVGLACGAGQWVLAVAATALALFILVILRPIERRLFPKHTSHRVRLRVAREAGDGRILARISETLEGVGVRLDELDLREGRSGDIIDLRCRARDRAALTGALGALRALPGVMGVRADLRETGEGASLPLRGYWRRNWPRHRGENE